LRITESGEVVRFEGNVVMNLEHLDTDQSAQAEETTSAAPVEPARSAKTTRSAAPKSGNMK
jgi:lipopolysaccharide export system protein LptC